MRVSLALVYATSVSAFVLPVRLLNTTQINTPQLNVSISVNATNVLPSVPPVNNLFSLLRLAAERKLATALAAANTVDAPELEARQRKDMPLNPSKQTPDNCEAGHLNRSCKGLQGQKRDDTNAVVNKRVVGTECGGPGQPACLGEPNPGHKKGENCTKFNRLCARAEEKRVVANCGRGPGSPSCLPGKNCGAPGLPACPAPCRPPARGCLLL